MVEHASDMTVSRAWAEYASVTSVDPKTLSLYETVFACHVEPVLGRRQVASLSAGDVEEWLAGARAGGTSPSVIRLARLVLAVVCRRARALGVIDRLPTDGVRVVRPVPAPARVLTPGEFTAVRDAMPTTGARLLSELLVTSGLRIGEALALTVADLAGDAVVVSRCLSEPGRRFSDGGQRFVIRPSTKNGAGRRVVVGHRLVERLEGWAAENGLSGGELLFPGRLVLPAPAGGGFPRKKHREPLTPERLAVLGTFTGPNGLEYQQGSVNGYVTGRCREACCRQAVSEYSAARARARRADVGQGVRARRPAPPGARADEGTSSSSEPPLGAVPPAAWGRVWSRAVEVAGLDFRPLPRQTRHAHASWLNGGGVSVEGIAGRLGHRDERSTRGYVRPVGPEPDPVALIEALLADGASPRGGAASGTV